MSRIPFGVGVGSIQLNVGVARRGGQSPRARYAEGAARGPVRGRAPAPKALGPLAVPAGVAASPRALAGSEGRAARP